MPVAKQHHTKARRDRARVFHKIETKKLIACPNCQSKILPHKVCPNCGFFKGKEVVDTLKRKNKKRKEK